MDTGKIIRMVYYVLIVILLFVGLYKVYGIVDTDPDAVKMAAVSNSIWQGFLYALIAAGIWIVASIINTVKDVKKSLFAIVGALALVGIFAVAYYGFSDATLLLDFEKEGLTAQASKASEAGLLTAFALAFIAFVVWIADGVKSILS
jgi:hypothetical protein